jgi:hypothetical protein
MNILHEPAVRESIRTRRPAVFGPLTGREWSRLQAVHLDHHLKQFGA